MRAQDYFIFDSARNFRDSNSWFRTRVKRQGLPKIGVDVVGEFFECLVFHSPVETARKAVGLILPSEVAINTHVLTMPGDDKVQARLMVKVREFDELIDPLSFRYGKICQRLYFFL